SEQVYNDDIRMDAISGDRGEILPPLPTNNTTTNDS
ncbi:unnamed protein product, partial [Rotaria sordida]